MKFAKYTASQLRDTGYSLQELVCAGFSYTQLIEANFSVKELGAQGMHHVVATIFSCSLWSNF